MRCFIRSSLILIFKLDDNCLVYNIFESTQNNSILKMQLLLSNFFKKFSFMIFMIFIIIKSFIFFIFIFVIDFFNILCKFCFLKNEIILFIVAIILEIKK